MLYLIFFFTIFFTFFCVLQDADSDAAEESNDTNLQTEDSPDENCAECGKVSSVCTAPYGIYVCTTLLMCFPFCADGEV